MDRQYSSHQQKIIKRYYDNRENLSLQRLQELVTDLYLAEGKAKQTKWKQAGVALEKAGVSAREVEHLLKKADPALLAAKITELMQKE